MTVETRNPINRREFITGGVAALGTLTALSGCSTFSVFPPPRPRPHCRWAMLSDTHVPADVNDTYRGFKPYEGLQKVVPQVIAAEPDGVVITGDLARLEGKEGDYVNLKGLMTPLAEKMPVIMALGNHDDRGNFSKAFSATGGDKQSVSGKHVVVVNAGPVRLIALDSLLFVNKVPGLLGKAQRQWLRDYLKSSDNTPTILCFHHTLADGDGDLLDLPRIYEIIKPIRKVKAIVYGHSHAYGFSRYKGIHLINLPATAYNFSDAEPIGWVEARLTDRGGRFVLHSTGGNTKNDGSVEDLTWRR